MKPTSNYLQTSDIEGAHPTLKGYQYFNKPNYSNQTEDIEKASPKKLHQKLEKQENNLITRDIEGAYPSKTGFITKRVGTNPLNPVYQLPKFETYEPPVPKFIRDQIGVSDIEGTKPEVYYKWNTRNTMSVQDIEGARPTAPANLKKPNFMDPRDINKGETHVYGRSTNPLIPEYLVRDADGALVTIGHVEGSIPSQSIKLTTAPHKRHLDNSDIEGAAAGTKGLGPVGKRSRNYEKHLVSSSDIEGAQSGTLKKGITTIRSINPLNPNYTWQTEDPLDLPKPKTIVQVPTDPAFLKNNSKFFGVSPAVSVSKSPPRSQSSSRQSGFNLNAGRFFAPEFSSPETKEKLFKQNAQKFYENQQKTSISHFENIRNPGSINLPKPKTNFVQVESPEFQKDLNKFYLGESRPGSYDKVSQQSFEKNKGNVSRQSVHSDAKYQFALARSEIVSPDSVIPEVPDRNILRNNSGVSKSQRSLLSSAAKSQLKS